MKQPLVSNSDLRNLILDLEALLCFGDARPLAAWRSFSESRLEGFFRGSGEAVVPSQDLQQFFWELIFDHSLDRNASFAWDADPDPDYRDAPSALEPIDSRDEAWANALEWIHSASAEP